MKLFFSARLIFIIICLTLPFNPNYAAEINVKGEPFAGIIVGNRVNVRAGNDTSFEVICQLNEGEEVDVVGQKEKWYKVELPKRALVYIHKTNVKRKDGTAIVNVDNSIVRVAATQSSTILGRLDKGLTIKIVREYFDWYEIEAPENTFGWIRSDYVKKESGGGLRKVTSIKDKLAQLQEAYNIEVKKPLREIELKGILDEYQKFIIQYKGSDEEQEAVKKIAEIKLKIAEVEHLKAKEEYEAKLKGISSPRPGEQPIATGIIEDVGMIYDRRSQFKLVEDDKPIGYLTSKAIDLNKYVNLKVNVWGIKKDAKGNMPLIEVDAIQVIQ